VFSQEFVFTGESVILGAVGLMLEPTVTFAVAVLDPNAVVAEDEAYVVIV
jgi:hypothetical protein